MTLKKYLQRHSVSRLLEKWNSYKIEDEDERFLFFYEILRWCTQRFLFYGVSLNRNFNINISDKDFSYNLCDICELSARPLTTFCRQDHIKMHLQSVCSSFVPPPTISTNNNPP